MALSEVGFTGAVANMVLSSLRDRGLLLVCGSTGSGKTDTAGTIVREAQVHGRQAVGLWSEDPTPGGVVDAGDLRNERETLRAVELAHTGLVVGVLRSGFGPAVVERFVDMGVPKVELESIAMWLITQRLVRGLCDACRTPMEAPSAVFEAAGLQRQGWPLSGGYVWQASGCPECKDGYRGRWIIVEAFLKSEGGRFTSVESFSNHATIRVLAGQIGLGEAKEAL